MIRLEDHGDLGPKRLEAGRALGTRDAAQATDPEAARADEPQGVGRLVAPGLALTAVTYGLAAFAYGLFLPQLRETFALEPTALGLIGAGALIGYCLGAVAALVLTARTGPRTMAVVAALVAVAGMAAVAAAPTAWVLAIGVFVAGASSGVASPALADAVATGVRADRRDRANAIINSGASAGIVLSAPVALIADGAWRVAWAAFAAIGLAVLVWNAAVMPRAADGRTTGTPTPPRLSVRYLVGPRSLPLFAAAFGIGLASAAYRTFSRELVVQAGDLSPVGSMLFWALIGAAGLAGGAAGDLVGRLGLRHALRAGLLAMAAAIALLPAGPGALPVVAASAALFGATFIALTGIALVWAVSVFRDRPSAGLGVAFLLMALGQASGATLGGLLAEATTLSTAFLAFAGVAAATALLRPHRLDT